MLFLFLFLVIITGIYPYHLQKKILIEQQQIIKIENLSNDKNLILLKNEVKENLQNTFTNHGSCNLKIYQYKIKEKEDFYYILAKTSLDHSTLISLNKAIFNYDINNFSSKTLILLSNCRGYFSLDSIDSEFFEVTFSLMNFSKKVYFYPGRKNLSLYTKKYNLEEPNQKVLKEEFHYTYPIQKGKISSFFGWRNNPITKKKEFHYGVDIQTEVNVPLYAPIQGKVLFSGFLKGYGNTVILENQSTKEMFLFAHLSKINIQKNDMVKKSQIIGYTGNTGLSTGPHLHLEYKKGNQNIDPLKIFTKYL